MTLSTQALQATVFSILEGDVTLSGLVTGIYDRVPEGSGFPYIVFGDVESRDASDSASRREEIDLRLQVYSDAEGKLEVQTIMARIHTLLHDQNPSLTGGLTLVNLRFAASAVRASGDGRHREGLIRFRAVVEG